MGYEDDTPKEVPDKKPESAALSGSEKGAIGDKYAAANDGGDGRLAGRSLEGVAPPEDPTPHAGRDLPSEQETREQMQGLTDAEAQRQQLANSASADTGRLEEAKRLGKCNTGFDSEGNLKHNITYDTNKIQDASQSSDPRYQGRDTSNNAQLVAAHEVAEAKLNEVAWSDRSDKYYQPEGTSINSRGELVREDGENYGDYMERYSDYLSDYQQACREFDETRPHLPAQPEQSGIEDGPEASTQHDQAMSAYNEAEQAWPREVERRRIEEMADDENG